MEPKDPAPLGLLGTFAAAERDDLLNLAQEAGQLGIFEWHVASGAIRLSPKLMSMYGLADFDGRFENWRACIFREDRLRVDDEIARAFAAGRQEMHADYRIIRANDNAMRWIQARTNIFYGEDHHPIRLVGVIVDVTDQKRAMIEWRAFTEALEDRVRQRTRELEEAYEARMKAEEQLRQAQKMEAVGQLTGGVAHDFNNLLTIVLGGLQAIGRQLPKLPASEATERIARSHDMAVQGVKRAATLTSRLLAFSRQQPLAPTAIDANKLVANTCEMLRSTLGEHIALETVLAGGLWTAFVDANQLENALLNLAVNARDAMKQGGRLTIETANASLDPAYVEGLNEPVAAGQYVMIAVADTGSGMKPEVLEKAFEPFFTTKEVGKGSGLGLSQIYGFVRQSSGHVRIYSEMGEGTTVKLYLPRHLGATQSLPITVDRPAPPSPGGECILLVEDDEALRQNATEMLHELGYRVFAAGDGEAALKELNRRERIDLLFTDVVMPGALNGRLLADEAVRLRPGLKVLFATGYTRNAIVHHGRLDPGVQLLTKPYSFEDLGRRLRLLLDSPT